MRNQNRTSEITFKTTGGSETPIICNPVIPRATIKTGRQVRLPVDWYSIGESNGTRNPEHRMKWRFVATLSGGVIKSVIKKSIAGNYYHILDSNDSSDRIIVLELVVRPRFNQIGVGDSPPLFLTGRIA